MDLVEEQDRALATGLDGAHRGVDDLADAFDTDARGILGDEGAFGAVGDDPRERGFARARRAVEDQAGHGIRGEHSAQEFAGPEDVGLADEFIERVRAHADRQRLVLPPRLGPSIGPEIRHRRMVPGLGW